MDLTLLLCIIISFTGFPIIRVQLINQTWWGVLLFAEAALWIRKKKQELGLGNRAGLQAGKPNPCARERALDVMPRWQEMMTSDQKLR